MVLALSLAPASEPVLQGGIHAVPSWPRIWFPFSFRSSILCRSSLICFSFFSLFSIHFAFLFETEYTTTDVSVEAGGHGDFIKSGVISPIAEKVRPVNYRG